MLEGLSVKLDGMYDDFENIVEDIAGGLNTNIVNIINNGDFSKETTPTGWRTQNSSFSIKDNTLTLYNRTGSSNIPAIYQETDTPFAPGKRVYMRALVKPRNNDLSRVRFLAYSDIAGDKVQYINFYDLEIDEQYLLTGIFTMPNEGAGNIILQIRTEYPSIETAIGKEVEIQKVLAIDLTTAFGSEEEITNKQVTEIVNQHPKQWFNEDLGAGQLSKTNLKSILNLNSDIENINNETETLKQDISTIDDSLLKNEIINGDFSKETTPTGWHTQGSSFYIRNNALTLYTSTSSIPAIWQETKIPYGPNKKIYMRALIKPKNDNLNRMRLVAYSDVTGNAIQYLNFPDLQENVQTLISGVFTMPTEGSGDIRLQIRAEYPNEELASGEEVEIQKVLAIDLTETFGQGNEPSTEQMDEIINGLQGQWFDDIAKMPDLQKSIMSYVFKERSKGGASLKRPIVCITIDDGTETDYSVFYPKLKDKDLTATSYIIGNNINKSGFMTSDQLIEMKLSGWGLECHTFTHPRLAELPEEEIREQLVLNNQFFESIGMPKPIHLAPPFGSVNQLVRDVASEYRKTLRNISSFSSDTYNDWDTIDFKSLNSINIDTTDIDKIKAGIDRGIANNGIIILFGHRIGDEQYQTPIATLDWLIDYIISSNLPTYTIDEMYRQVMEYKSTNK